MSVPIQVIDSRMVAPAYVTYGMGPNHLGISAIAPQIEIILVLVPSRLHASLGIVDHQLLTRLDFLPASLAFDLGSSLANQHPRGSVLVNLDPVEPTLLKLDRGNRGLYQEVIRTSEPCDQIPLVNLEGGSAI